MAYRTRSTARRTTSVRRGRAATTRRSPSRAYGPTRRRAAPARSGRRAAPAARARQQTVKIVIEGLPGSSVARRNPFERILGAPQVETARPRKAKL